MISSFSNPRVKRIKRLRQRKYRQREGAFFVEGIRPVLTALEQGADIETLVFAPDLLTSQIGLEAVRDCQARGVSTIALASSVFTAISERENPIGLGAIVRTNLWELERLPVTPTAVYLLLVGISDPGNLGAILRTVDAVGAQGIVLAEDTVDPFHPSAVKASMGTIFTVPVAMIPTMTQAWEWAATHRFFTLASSAHATASYREQSLRFPLLLLMGCEASGLEDSVLRRADGVVAIPMHGSASSLNLAVATGLLLYEVAYSRTHLPA